MSKDANEIFKLDGCDEGILDDMIRIPAVATADLAESKGITPNQITVFRTLLGIASLYFLWKGNFPMWIVLYHINYFLDCVDGIQARKYNKITKLGDILDHTSDAFVFLGAMYIIVCKYKLFSNIPLTALTITILFLFSIQIARQQEKCKDDPTMHGVLDNVKGIAKIPIPNFITKNVSAATVSLWVSVLPLFLV